MFTLDPVRVLLVDCDGVAKLDDQDRDQASATGFRHFHPSLSSSAVSGTYVTNYLRSWHPRSTRDIRTVRRRGSPLSWGVLAVLGSAGHPTT